MSEPTITAASRPGLWRSKASHAPAYGYGSRQEDPSRCQPQLKTWKQSPVLKSAPTAFQDRPPSNTTKARLHVAQRSLSQLGLGHEPDIAKQSIANLIAHEKHLGCRCSGVIRSVHFKRVGQGRTQKKFANLECASTSSDAPPPGAATRAALQFAQARSVNSCSHSPG